MKITKERKAELEKLHYGGLQSTEEYKTYLNEFVYNQSKNMSMEIDYILKKSLEDTDAPFSYDDLDLSYLRTEDLIKDIIEDIETSTEETQKEVFKEMNEEHNRKIKTIGDFEVFLKSLEEEELKNLVENEMDMYLSLNIYEYEEQAEVYQWFLMDDRILYQLEKKGEVILNGDYWGRQCCGQSIEMDSVIIEIFKEWYLNLYEVQE